MKKIYDKLGKKVIFFLVAFLSLINYGYALEETDIHSNEALLVNLNTDEVLFSKNTNDDAVPIASLTKIMTYVIVTEEITDLENTMITIPEGIIQNLIDQDASIAGLKEGYEYSVLDLLYGLMLPSGCDAAEVLASYIGEGNQEVFVQKMNQKALELGMNNTYYVDASGLGVGSNFSVSTEQDLYKLIKYAYKMPYFKKIISTEYYRMTGFKDNDSYTEDVRNTNYLMGEYSGGKYYYPYSIGGKTGSLPEAGKCLITIAQKGDLELVAITLGVPGEYNSTYNLEDHKKLFIDAFDKYTNNITIDIGAEFRSVEIDKKIKIETKTSSETPILWTSSDDSVAKIDENGIVTGVSQGQAIITATTSTGNLASTHVSVGFYNGVHTKYSTGPGEYDEEEMKTVYGPIDYAILKNKGFDYVIIRAGYGNSSEDKTFVENINNALENGMNVGIWYEGYAKPEDDPELEAANLLSILDKIPNIKEKIKIPIIYNLFYSDYTDPASNLESAKTFASILNENGYQVILELGKTLLSSMDLEQLQAEDIDLSIIYRDTPPDFKTVIKANDVEAVIWKYKDNQYMADDRINNNASLSLMYMNYLKLQTIHEEYNAEEEVIIEKEEINPKIIMDKKFVYTGSAITPRIIIEDEKDNIIPEDEYIVSYEDNIEIGIAKVKIKSKDTSNYIINVETTFEIVGEGKIEFLKTKNLVNAQIDEDTETIISNINFTEEELEEIKNGKNIEISLEVNDISDKISATEKEKIEKSSNDTVFMYLDINILKKIGSDTLTKITNTKKPIKISIVIPDELINTKTNLKRKFKIIRLHDGVISELDAELNGNILTFETDQFSTYALAYVDTDLNPIKNPKTGDNAYIYIFILILSIIGLRTGMKRLI